MKCTKCQNEIDEKSTVCPSCGQEVGTQLQQKSDNPVAINVRSIEKSIFLSVITLGIYAIYWKYLLVKNIRAMQQDNSSCVREMLCIIFLPFYEIYWWYTKGEFIKEEFSKRDHHVLSKGVLFLPLSVVGLSIVAVAIMQNDFNTLPNTGAYEKCAAKSIFKNQLFIPLAALIVLLLFNLIADPNFFKITLGYNSAGEPVLSGFLITILDNGSELAILAIGMTLVTAATGGQDISVGASIAIAGSVLLRMLCGSNPRPETLQTTVLVAFLVACVVAMLFGAFNGVMVAIFKIQPMIATLILYTAGRSIAAWINNNNLPVISEPSFSYYGGFIPGIPIPTPFFIALACVIIIAIVLKVTNLRLYTQSVGINESSAKLNGLNPVFIKILSFVILGACVAVVGLIKVSRFSTINYSVIAKDIEMDAILAVALGGNALSGGKFNMTASILGAYVIQCLTTTLYKFKIDANALPAYKAIVVIVLVVVSAPVVREKFGALTAKYKAKSKAKEVA